MLVHGFARASNLHPGYTLPSIRSCLRGVVRLRALVVALPRGGRWKSLLHHPSFTSVWSPLVARAIVFRGYVRDVSRVLSSRRSDNTNRGTFQSRCYGRAHPGTECVVHLEVTWFSVCCAFDFRYATELVIVTHQLFVLALTRYDQKSLTIK